jgi:hypothetical protein
MHPGFSMGNPFSGLGNFTFTDPVAPVPLPVRLVYQYHNRTVNDQLERQTVAVFEREDSRINVPSSDTVGPDWAYNGPGLTVDMHNAFQRAITTDERAGNVEPLSKPIEDERIAGDDDDEL